MTFVNIATMNGNIGATIEWGKGIEDSWTKVASFVPKLLGFVVLLVVGTIIAKIVRKVIVRVLSAAKIDNVVGRTSLGQSIQRSGFGPASKLLGQVAYLGLMLLVLQLAIGALGPNPISAALTSMMSFIPKIAVALAIIFVTGIVAEKVGVVVRAVTARRAYESFATKAAVASIWLIGGFAALDQIQVAKNIVDSLFKTVITSLGAILVIKFGVGGVWSARDRFWPAVYDAVGAPDKSTK
jgi:Conserved TM helix